MDTKHPASALHDGQSPIEESGALGAWGVQTPTHARSKENNLSWSRRVLRPMRLKMVPADVSWGVSRGGALL